MTQQADKGPDTVSEVSSLGLRYGKTVALLDISLAIPDGKMLGLIGPDGVGKSSLLSLLAGSRVIQTGDVHVLGGDMRDAAHRRRVCSRIAYMPQGLGKNLYPTLSVFENLDFFGRLFGHDQAERERRIDALLAATGMSPFRDRPVAKLSGGMKQKLGLCSALIHDPDFLILDEPTSGVDPVARDGFWKLLGELSRRDGVTIFVSTHFMNEAELCDRISLMHAGEVLVSDSAEAINASKNAETLEEAFSYLEEAIGTPEEDAPPVAPEPALQPARRRFPDGEQSAFSLRRLYSFFRLESLQLRRDPIRDYIQDIAGSRYFIEQPPLESHAEMDARMRAGELGLAFEIPPGFARRVARGETVEISAWIDGGNPLAANKVSGYVQGMHADWLQRKAREAYGDAATAGNFELVTRFRYNPDLQSIIAIVPAVIPLLLLMIPGVQYSGQIDPVSALSGFGRIIGEVYPTSWFITVARGAFSKGLGFADLSQAMTMIALAIPAVLGLATLLLRKQAR